MLHGEHSSWFDNDKYDELLEAKTINIMTDINNPTRLIIKTTMK